MEVHVDGFRFDLASIMTRGSRLSGFGSLSDYFSKQWRVKTHINFFFCTWDPKPL